MASLGGKTVKVEIRDPEGRSYLYFNMSKVPRIGDTVSIISRVDDDEGFFVEGIVIKVNWLLVLEEKEEDGSECVAVYLGVPE